MALMNPGHQLGGGAANHLPGVGLGQADVQSLAEGAKPLLFQRVQHYLFDGRGFAFSNPLFQVST